MSQVVTINRASSPAMTAGNAMVPQSFSEAVALAGWMARSKMVPKHFHGKPEECLVIIEQAMRWEMSPYAVIQCASMVHERPMYEGKLVGAVVNARGPLYGLSGRLHYDYSGEGAARKIVAWGLLDGRREEVEVEWSKAKTSNEHWTKQPDQQLAYHAARVWARRHMPELMLGVYSPEEMENGKAPDSFTGTTIEAEPDHGQPRATAAAIDDTIPALNEGPEYPFQTAKGGRIFRTGAEWAEQWRRTIDACERTAALDKLQSARELNAGAFTAIAEHDAAAVEEVTAALDRALGETAET